MLFLDLASPTLQNSGIFTTAPRRSSIRPRRDRGRGFNGFRDRLETETLRPSRGHHIPGAFSSRLNSASSVFERRKVAGKLLQSRGPVSARVQKASTH